MKLIDSTPASGPYEEPTPVELTWEVEPPEHADLVFAERTHRFSESQGMEGGFVHATWAVVNQADTPIRTLKYRIRFLDETGRQLESKTRLATFSSHPPIRPGDVFLEATTTRVPNGYDDYELAILEYE